MARPRRSRTAALFAFAALVLAGAQPSGEPAIIPAIEIWLDRPIPTDAAPGTTVVVGMMVWDRDAGVLRAGSRLLARLLTPTDDGAITEAAEALADWPGHYTASVVVPEGGAARLFVGTLGRQCSGDVCEPAIFEVAVAGVGPPPEAPLPVLATVDIDVPDEISTGTATDVVIQLTPRTAWAPETFEPGDHLVLRVREPRGVPIQEIRASRRDPVAWTYEATITLPEPGTYLLEVATREDAEAADVFASSLVTVTAVKSGALPPVVGFGAGLILPVLVAVLVIVTIGVVLAIRRG